MRGGSREPGMEEQGSWRVWAEGGLGQEIRRTEETQSWVVLWMAFWGKEGGWSGMHREVLGSPDLRWICGIRNNHEWNFLSDKSCGLWAVGCGAVGEETRGLQDC